MILLEPFFALLCRTAEFAILGTLCVNFRLKGIPQKRIPLAGEYRLHTSHQHSVLLMTGRDLGQVAGAPPQYMTCRGGTGSVAVSVDILNE